MRNPYYYFFIPKTLREFLNRLFPGLLAEPVPVRVRNDLQERQVR